MPQSTASSESGNSQATPPPKAKKPRDMPSRPLSAYNFFFRAQRAKILEEREEQARITGQEPDKSDLFSILGKTIAARWKTKNEEERQEYKDMAAQDMKRYRAEMDHYHESIANSVHENKEKSSSTPKKKKNRPPKKRKSAPGGGSAAAVAKKAPKSANKVNQVSPRQDAVVNPVVPSMNPQMQLSHMAPTSTAAVAAGLGAQSLDLLAYQNMLQQREIAALREQNLLASKLGLVNHPGGGLGANLGGAVGGTATDAAYLERLALLGSQPAAGMVPSLDVGLSTNRGLTREEQVYLLRRAQEEADQSLHQRLGLVQSSPPAVEVPQLPPSTLALLKERQRLLEIQQLERLLAGSGAAGLPPTGL